MLKGDGLSFFFFFFATHVFIIDANHVFRSYKFYIGITSVNNTAILALRWPILRLF